MYRVNKKALPLYFCTQTWRQIKWCVENGGLSTDIFDSKSCKNVNLEETVF